MDVAEEGATAESGADGRSKEEGRQQGEVVRGDGTGGAGTAGCFLGPELRGGSQADVGLLMAGAWHLCGLVGTNQSGADGDDYLGSMGGGRQQGETVDGGTAGAGAASCFPGSELQVESRAGAARKVAMAGDGGSGGSMVSERQEGRVLHSGNLGKAEAASCFPGPKLQIQSRRRMWPVEAGAIGGWRAGGCGRLRRWLATGGNRRMWPADIGAVDGWTASGCG